MNNMQKKGQAPLITPLLSRHDMISLLEHNLEDTWEIANPAAKHSASHGCPSFIMLRSNACTSTSVQKSPSWIQWYIQMLSPFLDFTCVLTHFLQCIKYTSNIFNIHNWFAFVINSLILDKLSLLQNIFSYRTKLGYQIILYFLVHPFTKNSRAELSTLGLWTRNLWTTWKCI